MFHILATLCTPDHHYYHHDRHPLHLVLFRRKPILSTNHSHHNFLTVNHPPEGLYGFRDCQWFSAERCNSTANLAIVAVCGLSVVCRRLWRECIVTKRLQLWSHSFRWNVDKYPNVSLIRCATKFEGGPLNTAFKLGWGGFRYLFAAQYLENGARQSLDHN